MEPKDEISKWTSAFTTEIRTLGEHTDAFPKERK